MKLMKLVKTTVYDLVAYFLFSSTMGRLESFTQALFSGTIANLMLFLFCKTTQKIKFSMMDFFISCAV